MRLTPVQIETIAKEYPEDVNGLIEVRPSDAVDVFNATAVEDPNTPDGITAFLTVHADGTVHRTTV